VTEKCDILVLGASGRIGGVLRKVWGPSGALWQARGERPGFIHGDLLENPGALIRAGKGAGAVLCLSGVVPGKGDVALNTVLGAAAVEIGAAIGAPVLLASSAAVYGRAGGRLSESAVLAPESDYGRAKAEMEARCAELGAARGVPVTSLRIGNVAGLDAILGGWRAGFRLDRFEDGRTPRRSYIGVRTLADVLRALALRAGGLPPVLNIAAPVAIEMGALLDAAGLPWEAQPAPPGAIAQVALDVTLLQGIYPLSPASGSPGALVAEWRGLTGEAS
jgi:nucleoside-diphosphate-sugar epimerase